MKVSGQLQASAALDKENFPCTHWIEGWVSRTACLDTAEEESQSCR
jgi:hypothetical protein